MPLSAREVAERIKTTGQRIAHRHATVVSVQADHTCTVTEPGSDVEIPNVRYSASVCPLPGARVILEAVGTDLFVVDTIAPTGPAYCSVRRITDQNTATATPTQFVFGASAEIRDPWGMISGNTLVVKVPGIYVVSFQYGFEGNSTGIRTAEILKDGAVIARDRRSSVGPASATCGVVMTQDVFELGDVITVQVTQNSGGNLALLSGEVSRPRLVATYLGPA